MIAIRGEIDRVEAGEWPADDNPLRAPRTPRQSLIGEWDAPVPARAGGRSPWRRCARQVLVAGRAASTARTATATSSAPARPLGVRGVTGLRRDHHGGGGVFQRDHPGVQSAVADRLDQRRCLELARLDEQRPAWGQPGRSAGDDPAEDVQPVHPSVECEPRLVLARLRRHQADPVGRHVRRVGHQDVDPTAQVGRQRLVEVSLMDPPTGVCEVAPGAADRRRVQVDCVQLDLLGGRSQCRCHRAGAAAQVDHHDRSGRVDRSSGRRDLRSRLAGEVLGPAPRDEDPRVHRDPLPAELGPAEHMLERDPETRRPTIPSRSTRSAAAATRRSSLVLSEHAAGGPQPADDVRRDR